MLAGNRRRKKTAKILALFIAHVDVVVSHVGAPVGWLWSSTTRRKMELAAFLTAPVEAAVADSLPP